ncbi:unnamed protein product [Brassica oleracea var. botrytis]
MADHGLVTSFMFLKITHLVKKAISHFSGQLGEGLLEI